MIGISMCVGLEKAPAAAVNPMIPMTKKHRHTSAKSPFSLSAHGYFEYGS